ncbi:N-acetyl-gamma-glutamyl-phosphate reductase [Candidatus Magnetoovum chiemensis]|nr:N-acetyl-gamma-glutamyl-phosphate reductase [Candidatus Magnetoovum chiemensis]
MYNVAICGASGYTGSELLRILSAHRNVNITAVTSEKSAGKPVTALFPHLDIFEGMLFEPLDKQTLLRKADVFFMSLPHGASLEAVDYFYRSGKKVIDLSADYRIKDPLVYEKWYGIKHDYSQALSSAVYGLSELYREEIKGAQLIAAPGCYPTSAILGLYPALKGRLIEPEHIVIDAKSGTSGAGRKADLPLSFSEVFAGFRAYSVSSHRHTPEIEQELSNISNTNINVNFTAHLLPVSRGILSTIYAQLRKDAEAAELINFYRDTYKNDRFVKVLDAGDYPNIKHAAGTNKCIISLAVNKNTNTLIVISVIDNLIKGASGQAVQDMNLMLGLDETTALLNIPAIP